MSQFDASVFKTWAKETTPKYTERKLNLRQVMTEFVGKCFGFTDNYSLFKTESAAGRKAEITPTILNQK